MKIVDKQLRQRLGAWLLRHGWRYPGRTNWTQAYFRWLEQQRAASTGLRNVLKFKPGLSPHFSPAAGYEAR